MQFFVLVGLFHTVVSLYPPPIEDIALPTACYRPQCLGLLPFLSHICVATSLFRVLVFLPHISHTAFVRMRCRHLACCEIQTPQSHTNVLLRVSCSTYLALLVVFLHFRGYQPIACNYSSLGCCLIISLRHNFLLSVNVTFIACRIYLANTL